MSLVLDASVTIAFVHQAELTNAILQVFDHVELYGALAPPLWKVEVANVLQKNVRRGTYDTVQRDRLISELTDLQVGIDMKAPDFLWSTTLDLAHRHTLTVYDAIYLECALRNQLPLATLDVELRAAAAAEGVPLLGL